MVMSCSVLIWDGRASYSVPVSKLLDYKVFRSMKKKDVFVRFLDASKRRLRTVSVVGGLDTATDRTMTNVDTSDDETETWTFNEEDEMAQPQSKSESPLIQVLVGETTEAYVIILRTISQTNIAFKLKGKQLIITGTLPPLPSFDGVDEWKNENWVPLRTKATKFTRTVNFSKDIDSTQITKKKQATTITITIAKTTS